MIYRSQGVFLGTSALLFAASAAVTIVWCGSMSAMGGMAMPGDWTMSMAWMRMPGQSWSGAAATFLGMWVVMMVAMMLPSLVPMLLRYREAACCVGQARLARMTMLVALGYFFVWALLGVIAFPLGVGLASLTMQLPEVSRAVPVATGAVVVIAGALQFSAWKARLLACCRGVGRERGARPERGALSERPALGCGGLGSGATAAWREGVRLGLHCTGCCAGLTAILLVVGVMDLRAMAVVAAAITLERLAPSGQRIARVIGGAVMAAGLVMLLRAAGGMG